MVQRVKMGERRKRQLVETQEEYNLVPFIVDDEMTRLLAECAERLVVHPDGKVTRDDE